MKIIEFDNDHRRKHFHFFNSMDQPHFSLCGNVDASKLFTTLKKSGKSLSIPLVYILSSAANSIPQFKWRIRENTIVEHDWVHPSFTVKTDVSEVFSFCEVKFYPDWKIFSVEAEKRIHAMKTNPVFEDEEGRDHSDHD